MFSIGGPVKEGANTASPRNAVVFEEEKSEPRRGLGMGLGSVQVEPVVLVYHVLDVLVCGDGDQGVEILVGELVLDG